MRRASTEEVIQAALTAYNMSREELTKRTRSQEIVKPRQVVHYMCAKNGTSKLFDIAHATGHSSHRTVIYSRQLIEDLVGIDYVVAEYLQKLEKEMHKRGLSTGYRVKKAKKKKVKPKVDPYFNRWIAVKVVDRKTGESFIADSMKDAQRKTGIPYYSIRMMCKGNLSLWCNYKLSYDV